jgi:hypothetical protein
MAATESPVTAPQPATDPLSAVRLRPGERGYRPDPERTRATRLAREAAAGELQPLRAAPAPARRSFAALALRAQRSYSAAVKLKCIECCGWNRPEAVACQIQTCALWGSGSV